VAEVANVNDLLAGHVALDLECLDRVYLNGYVPNLQVGGQVVTFLCERMGAKVPSRGLFNKIGTAFRRAVMTFATANQIPVVRFARGDRKADVMRPYLEAATEPGVVAIGRHRPRTRPSPGPPRQSPRSNRSPSRCRRRWSPRQRRRRSAPSAASKDSPRFALTVAGLPSQRDGHPKRGSPVPLSALGRTPDVFRRYR
jgi:hypothetical protein